MNVFQALALLLTFALLAGVGGVLSAGLIIPIAAGASALSDSAIDAFEDLPTNLEPGELSQVSHIYANDGTTLLATYFIDNRVVVPLEQMSINLQNAVIAIEDKRFYSHGGVDPKGLLRAALNNAKDGADTQGASTLTQQYVKNVLISDAAGKGDVEAAAAAKEQSISRKLREAKLAISLEKRMSKDEILAGYLNIAQFGASVNGVETAAQRYFGKSAADVSIVEAATIAGITNSPTAFDPIRNPAKSESRRNLVLSEMYKQSYITRDEYTAARATPIADTLNVQPIKLGCVSANEMGAGYFCDYVTKVLLKDGAFGATPEEREAQLYRGGLEIVTTIDLRMQAIANEELRAGVPPDNPYGFADAMVSVLPGSGEIVVMAQNTEYTTSKEAEAGATNVNYSTGKDYGNSNGFQAGSTFKTFVLAQWLQEGHTLNEIVSANERSWTGAQFVGTPTSCAVMGSDPWTPKNSDGRAKGNVSVLNATANSINTAYVSMASQVNLCGVRDLAASVGFEPSVRDDVEVVRTMTLGVTETSPLSMANAYATFASGGVRCTPIAIKSVVSRDGESLPVPPANCAPALDSATVNGVNYALQRVLSPQGGAHDWPLASRTAAGKTGTTNDNADAWFVGYTPDLATAVWMGDPLRVNKMQGVTIAGRYWRNVYGASVAAPTWKHFMDRALEGTPDIGFPDIAPAQLGAVQNPNPTPTAGDGATTPEGTATQDNPPAADGD